ncbi:MAG: glycosyltransferase family 39 protein [Pseudomonadota bacterium]
MLALRLAVNAAVWVPVHFDEAQYWAYGQELAWGYFSKPPGVGAVIRLATEIGGDTMWMLRLPSALAHAVIAAVLFALGRRLFDAATGFWAALAYTAAPGVSVSAMIMSTDPPMMAAWALALLFWVRAAESGRLADWAAMGAAIGLGALAKYTMLALPAGALGYALFSARGRDWRGAAVAAGVALAVLAPNLVWNAANGFATVVHVAEDADPGQGYGNPIKFAEFLGGQFGVIGPVLFVAILVAAWRLGDWRGDWRMRLLAWSSLPLLAGMLVLAFATRAQLNWAAPAYVAGTLFAVRWLLTIQARRWLRAQVAIGTLAAAAVYGLAAVYAADGPSLARSTDPFKKMRLAEPFCDRALAAMAEEGAETMLSLDRRRLSECMFLGGLGWDEIAVWAPLPAPQNHHELVARLSPGDERRMLLVLYGQGDALPGAGTMPSAFREARLVDEGRFDTHRDRHYSFALWVVQGFEGYPDDDQKG